MRRSRRSASVGADASGCAWCGAGGVAAGAARKPGFRELEPALRAAVARRPLAVPEAEAHRIESAARPDLPLRELLRELSRGLQLPNRPGARERQLERRLAVLMERDFPERRGRGRPDRPAGTRACAPPLPARYVRRVHGRRRAPERRACSLPLRALHRPPRRRRSPAGAARGAVGGRACGAAGARATGPPPALFAG
jgi:hypothetical protein